MKKILGLILIGSLLFASCDTVGTIKGMKYIDTLKQWESNDVSVYVCDGDALRYYIDISGITPTRIGLSSSERQSLITVLKKAVKWANIAKTKRVPSFSKKLFENKNYVEDTYTGARTNYLKIDFFTAQKGVQNDIVIYGIDFDNQFEDNTVYLSINKVPQLINLLQKAKIKYEKVKKADAIAKEFK